MDNPQAKDFDAILDEIMEAKREVPNYEEVSLAGGVAVIGCGAGLAEEPGVRRARLAGSKSRIGDSARYFLSTTQGGDYDGTGYVMIAAVEKGAMVGHIGKFAICKHEVVGRGTREQEMRGWHPGHCKLCGLDMSVDSGD